MDFAAMMETARPAVRPCCRRAHDWQVYFDTNRLTRETFGGAGCPAAEAHVRLHQPAA